MREVETMSYADINQLGWSGAVMKISTLVGSELAARSPK